jgi:hypothetical protein
LPSLLLQTSVLDQFGPSANADRGG